MVYVYCILRMVKIPSLNLICALFEIPYPRPCTEVRGFARAGGELSLCVHTHTHSRALPGRLS